MWNARFLETDDYMKGLNKPHLMKKITARVVTQSSAICLKGEIQSEESYYDFDTVRLH